jgi:N4-gp56 family major capsid protein
MANSTTTTLNDLLPQIVAEALFQAQEQSIMRNLVRNYTIPAGSGKSIVVPTYAPVAAHTVNEGTDLATAYAADGSGGNPQAISTGGVTIEVGEVGIMTNVTDLARVTSSSNVIADVGKLFGAAIAKKMDQDLIAKFASFATANDIGSATAAMSAADIFKAIALLRQAGVSGSDIACVVNPLVAYDMKSGLTSTFAGHAGDLSNEAMRSGYVGTVAGVNIFESANVPHTTGDSVGGVFHKDALALAMMQDISIETERNASLRADELVATAVYGVNTLFDTYGCQMTADSTLADA